MESINSVNQKGYVAFNAAVPATQVEESLKKESKDRSSQIIAGLAAVGAIAAGIVLVKKGKAGQAIDNTKQIIDVAKTEAVNVQKHTVSAAGSMNLSPAEVNKTSKEITEAIKKTDVSSEIKNAAQHIKNASSDELSAVKDAAAKKSKVASAAAESAKENAEKLGTRKSRIRAKVAENRATRAELSAKQTSEAVQKRQDIINADNMKKAEARQVTANRTPEQLQKQEVNGEKALEGSLKRDAKNELHKPVNIRQSSVDVATNRIIPSISKKYPNTDEGNIALLDMMSKDTEAPRRNAAKAILELRKVI